MSTIGVDAYCVTCGEDVENPIDGRCPKCSRTVIGRVSTPAPTTNHRKPTLAEALASLIADIQHEIEEQEKARTHAIAAVTVGKAVLVHLQRATDVAAGTRVASCTECGKAIGGRGSTGLCQSCATKAYRARRSA